MRNSSKSSSFFVDDFNQKPNERQFFEQESSRHFQHEDLMSSHENSLYKNNNQPI